MTHINQTLETIYNRHSTRQFNRDPVDEKLLRMILDAANQAPSAHNQQSWRFMIIRGAKKDELAQMVGDRAALFPKPSSSLLRMASRSISSAPVVIGVANTGELIRHGRNLISADEEMAYDFFRTMEIQSSAAAVENMLLAAESLGLSSVWLGILFLIKDDVLTFLGEPDGEFMAVIPAGYAAKASKGPKKRDLDSCLSVL